MKGFRNDRIYVLISPTGAEGGDVVQSDFKNARVEIIQERYRDAVCCCGSVSDVTPPLSLLYKFIMPAGICSLTRTHCLLSILSHTLSLFFVLEFDLFFPAIN